MRDVLYDLALLVVVVAILMMAAHFAPATYLHLFTPGWMR